MKIAYRENDDTLLIQDQSQRKRLLLNILYICQLLVGVFILISSNFNLSSPVNQFYILSFIIFTIGILRLNIIKARTSVISLKEIIDLKSITSFNSIRYYLLLSNRKKRFLNFGDNFETIDQLKLILNEKEIQTE